MSGVEVMAWHYTIGLRAQSILSDGLIRPATAGVPAGETPVVWFSTRQHWEPTANKAMAKDGLYIRRLTFEETIERGGGGWRFGLPVDRLVAWRNLSRLANISRETANGLVRAARKSGADPAFWYAALGPVVVAECVIERLDGDEWHRLVSSKVA
jgi:hypothetical protein